MKSSNTSSLFNSILFAICAMPFVASGAAFSENFDVYVPGSQMHGQGGWKGWDNSPAAGALVSSAFSASPMNSVSITGGSDLVHTFTGVTSGIWTFSLRQFVPTGATGDSYVILLNQYNDSGPYSWSVQTHANMDTNLIIADYPGATSLPLIRDQWVEFRAEINLNTNSVSEFYNGVLLSSHAWRDAAALADPNSLNAVTAVDLYANGASPVFYDNISLTQVPETSSSALLLLCVTGLAGVRRRPAQG